MVMTESATVTSKSMVNIPASIRRKFNIKEGDKVVFLEGDEGIIMVPVPPLGELAGSASHQKEALLEGIRELEREHRKESQD